MDVGTPVLVLKRPQIIGVMSALCTGIYRGKGRLRGYRWYVKIELTHQGKTTNLYIIKCRNHLLVQRLKSSVPTVVREEVVEKPG
jgi:hypothetical protein